MKKLIAIVLIVVMCLSLCSCMGMGKKTVEGKGFDSPEEALLAYAKALQSGDVSAMLSTFAVETFVENFDIVQYWEHLNCAPPTGTQIFDSNDAYTTDINLIKRQYAITNELSNLYRNISMGEDSESYYSIIAFNGAPYDDADDFYDDLMMDDWMDTLSRMKFDDDFVYLDDVVDNNHTIDQTEDNLDKQCDYYGCDEIVPLALEIRLDREDYLLCMNVACYDGKWYNLSQFGTIALLLNAPANCGGICVWE